MNFTTELDDQFSKGLSKVISELKSYKEESSIWKINGDIKNSGGNLALHLVGNLNHFVGLILGDIEYERDRPAEFATKDYPLKNLVQDLQDCIRRVSETLHKLEVSDLNQEYPLDVVRKMTTSQFLMHLLGHLNYHTGQINYHRRLLDS